VATADARRVPLMGTMNGRVATFDRYDADEEADEQVQ